MGNCQAAAAAAMTEIQYPEGKTERIYGPISASHVMATKPGHYVAVLMSPHAHATQLESNNVINNKVEKYLKLLSPEETLLLGNVYRLVTFEGFEGIQIKTKCQAELLTGETQEALQLPMLHRDGVKSNATYQTMDDMRAFEQTKSEAGDKSKTEESMGEDNFRKVEMCRTQWKPALQCIKEDTGFDNYHQLYTE